MKAEARLLRRSGMQARITSRVAIRDLGAEHQEQDARIRGTLQPRFQAARVSTKETKRDIASEASETQRAALEAFSAAPQQSRNPAPILLSSSDSCQGGRG